MHTNDYNFLINTRHRSYDYRSCATYFVTIVKPYRDSFKLSCYAGEDVNVKITQEINRRWPRRCMQVGAVEYNYSEV